MDFKSHYNLGKRPKGITFKDPTLCQQHLKMSTDINAMIQRVVSGDHTALMRGVYVDASDMPSDYHEASNRCAFARSAWHDLPESVKASFGSPEAFINFVDSSMKAQRAEPENSKPVSSDGKSDASTSTVEPAPKTT